MLLNLIAAIAASTVLAGAAPPAGSSAIQVADSGPCSLTVLLQCGVAEEGTATDCHIVSEDPNSLGAGAAALSMSRSFRLTRHGDGSPVLLPVRIQTGQCHAGR